MKKLLHNRIGHFSRSVFLLSCICFFSFQVRAQDSTNTSSPPKVSITTADTTKKISAPTPAKADPVIPKRAEKLIASFDTLELLIEEGDVFSKNLRIVSNVDVPLTFRVDVNYPAEWKSLVNSKKSYFIAAHDTMYVPVRLIPLGRVKGNTKYMINAYLFDTIGSPITTAYVNASKPRIAKWTLNIGPNKKIYFRNDSNESRFTINVGNEGTESQDLYLSMGNYRKDIILSDTNGKIIKKPNFSFTLRQYADTTFHYGVRLYSAARNMRRVDTEGYRPGFNNEKKTYSIFLKTSETSLMGKYARQMSQKVDFVKLPNEQKISQYGMYSAPLTMDFNLTNLLSQQPVAYLYLNGATALDNGGTITYNTQLIGAFGIQGGSYFSPPFYVFGYYDDKYSLSVGNVGGSGGIGVGGRGVNGSYRLNRRHRVGAFFVVNVGFLNRYTYYGAGLNYNYTGNRLRGELTYVHVQNNIGNSQLLSDYVTGSTSLSVARSQSVSFGVNLGRNSLLGTTKYGYSLNAGYSGSFIKNRLQSTLTFGYFSKTYTFYDQGERYVASHSSNFRLNQKWSFRLLNSYNQYSYLRPVLTFTNYYPQQTFNNTLGTSRSLDAHSAAGLGIFYNIFIDNFYQYTSHSRGVVFNYNYNQMEDNLLCGFTAQFGYNRIVTIPNDPERFFMSLFSLIKYRVYSLNLRYTNGLANGAYISSPGASLYSENFSAGINHQYQFRNPHFILNNSITYSLLPQIDRHSLGFTPELNYFTKDGWRIRVTAGYYFTSSKIYENNPYKSYFNTNNINENQNTRVTSESYMLMLGVRKEFGIPLPFIKRRFPTLNFIAFVDINGNGKFDNDEARLENVVINVNGWEVLTNEKGEAQLKNMPEGNFIWQAFSLDDLKGYFPNIPDRINVVAKDSSVSSKSKPKPTLVPFVKGIRLYGRVYVDREKLSVDALSALDLSGIKISVNCDGKKSTSLTDKEGSFMLYLPYGKYTVSLDEKVLGDRYRLLQNDLEVQLDKGVENMFVSFYVAENQRKIIRKRFGQDGKLIEDAATKTADSLKNANVNPNAGKDLVAEANAAAAKVNPRPAYDVAKDAFLSDKTDATTTKGLIYTIQLGAFQKPLNPGVFRGLKNMLYERIDNEFVRIAVGTMKTETEATLERDNLIKVGFPAAFVSVYNDGKNISLAEAAQIKKNQRK